MRAFGARIELWIYHFQAGGSRITSRRNPVCKPSSYATETSAQHDLQHVSIALLISASPVFSSAHTNSHSRAHVRNIICERACFSISRGSSTNCIRVHLTPTTLCEPLWAGGANIVGERVHVHFGGNDWLRRIAFVARGAYGNVWKTDLVYWTRACICSDAWHTMRYVRINCIYCERIPQLPANIGH